jgi:hypothetical protein
LETPLPSFHFIQPDATQKVAAQKTGAKRDLLEPLREGCDRHNNFAGALYNPVSESSLRGDDMADPSYEELKARVAELEKQGGGRRTGSLEFRVGEKGGVSVYGLGRFPVTLYYEQWVRLLEAAPQLHKFLEENKSEGKLKLKEK